jgi:GTP-binding protein
MKFVDRTKIFVKAGDGGRGCASFRREKFVPKGGPDGGDGGDGGNVYFRVDPGLSTLLKFRKKVHFRAGNGSHGKGKNMHGRNGPPLIIDVPPGTMLYAADSGSLLTDLTDPGEELLLFRGGRGGRGNTALSYRGKKGRLVDYAEDGGAGEEGWLVLELKLLADVGLVGLPNAGKSTFLSAVSEARPKIADYPFTTLSPQLGVVRWHDFKSFVIADIPGLIEGASQGHGLGFHFLRQIERTSILLHLIDLSVPENEGPIANYESINRELEQYGHNLLEKPQFIVFTKMDIPDAQARASLVEPYFQAKGLRVFQVSAVTGRGMKELVLTVGGKIEELRTANNKP